MRKQLKMVVYGFLLIVLLFGVPLKYYLIAPGPVYSAKNFVITTPHYREENHFYAPSVALYENAYFSLVNTTLFNKFYTNPFYLVYATISPAIEIKRIADYFPEGMTSEEFEERIKAATELSTTNIKYLVAKKLNTSVEKINVTINLTTEGPSVALVLALEALQQLSEEDLTKGFKIGAIGTVDREGNVYSVGAAKQKILAAEREKLDILFIPARDYAEEIKKMTTRVTIIPVQTLDEVLTILNQKKKGE